MERVWASSKDDREQTRSARDLFEAFVLPSRASELASLHAALEAQEGPALITGEAGVGKTWLWRRLRADRPASRPWVDIDLSPTDAPADFYRAIGHGLGLIDELGASPTRLDLAASLVEAHVEGRRWVLVVDEAHNLSAGVLEEIRLQCNRLGRPGGFAGLVLVGQTPLARRLATRSLAALEVRLSARVHLRTLDVEEARALLDRLVPGISGDVERFERLHRDAGGGPRRLILLSTRHAAHLAPAVRSGDAPRLDAAVAGGTTTPRSPEAVRDVPLLGPSRPPLRLEDGLIEVGWDADRGSIEGDSDREANPSTRPGDDESEDSSECEDIPDSGPEAEVDEAIEDPYTAIQARSARAPSREPLPDPVPADPRTVPVVAEPERSVVDSCPNVWAEGQHEFAPYSHLFSRLRQPRD